MEPIRECSHPGCDRIVTVQRPKPLCFSHRRHVRLYGETRDVRPRRSSRIGPGGRIWCPQCQTYKPRDAYSANVTQPYGVSTYCRACRSEQRKSAA